MKTFDIEQYSRRIVESKPSQRVSWLIDATRENMLVKNEKAPDPPSVLNEKTGKLPVIIRKAMAERAKLSYAPVGIWDKQVFAGCLRCVRKELSIHMPFLNSRILRNKRKEKNMVLVFTHGLHISPDYKRLLKLGTDGIRKWQQNS
ncbi:MAG: hypothetical protein ACLUOI_02000 [Eisenbergiella sp.]